MLLPKPFWAGTRGLLQALRDPYVPILAHLVTTRRCNLACAYCNEFDHISAPIPTEILCQRLDHLAALGTVVVTLTGGEPLLQPQLDEVIAHAVRRGVVCTTITNGYPLTRSWVERLNKSGLTMLQISIDNLEPNETSQKSWSRLRSRLELLRDHARFGVNVNAVLGSCPLEETRHVVEEVRSMGFYMTIGLLHDHEGQLDGSPGRGGMASFYEEMHGKANRSLFHRAGQGWEQQMLRDGYAEWKCRAGGRYLYIGESGVVSYCSQRRGEPGIPLLEYTRADIEREFHTSKDCALRCTIGCVRRVSAFDQRRAQADRRSRTSDEVAVYPA